MRGGGTAVVTQRVLEAVFGDDAVRKMTSRTRDALRHAVRDFVEIDMSPFAEVCDGLALDPTRADALRKAAARLTEAGER